MRVVIEDPETDVDMDNLDLGSVFPGDECEIRVVRVVNLTETVTPVVLECRESFHNQIGEGIETYLATLFSVRGDLFTDKVYMRLDSLESQDVYVKWRPSSNAAYGQKEWAMVLRVPNSVEENLCQ